MKIKTGNTYKCENGFVFEAVKNNLPYYKFSCKNKIGSFDGELTNCSETWTEDGIAYHNDCGYNVIFEYQGI